LAGQEDAVAVRLQRRSEPLLGITIAGRDVAVGDATVDRRRHGPGSLLRRHILHENAAQANDRYLAAGFSQCSLFHLDAFPPPPPGGSCLLFAPRRRPTSVVRGRGSYTATTVAAGKLRVKPVRWKAITTRPPEKAGKRRGLMMASDRRAKRSQPRAV